VEKEEFVEARTRLDKTQKEMAQLLGVSVKAIYSYEQGWRSIPTHVERQVFFLLSRKRGAADKAKPCWTVKKCPPKRRKECPAYEYNAGRFCWLVNGTICECKAQKNWKEKMQICRQCEVMRDLL
jgi:DNA-binding XRE family transcriptional regulator